MKYDILFWVIASILFSLLISPWILVAVGILLIINWIIYAFKDYDRLFIE